MRLIDADALIQVMKALRVHERHDVMIHALSIVANAPTVQREGWVSVPIEPTREMQEAAIDNYMECPDCISWTGIYKAMIQAAPTDKE